MILNGKPLTAGEFAMMDQACDWQASKLMQSESPTFMLLCHWIVLRRQAKGLTWDEYSKREIDWEQLAKELDITEANPQNGNGLEPKPVSVGTGVSVPGNLTGLP